VDISNIDIYFLMEEFKKLIGSRIENCYTNNKKFYLKFYSKNLKETFLVKDDNNLLFLSNEKNETNIPNPFTMTLRKILKNSIIQNVEQIKNERVLKFEISKKNDKEKDEIQTYFIYIELFLGGNIIFTNEEKTILNIFSKRIFKERTLKIGEKYILPVNEKNGFIDFDIKKFIIEFEKSEIEVGKFLAGSGCGFSKKYSNEILKRCEINQELTFNNLKKNDFEKLEKEIFNIKNEKLNPNIFKTGFYPFKFKILEEQIKEIENLDTFNNCIKKISNLTILKKDSRELNYLNEIKKLKKRIKIQKLKKEKILIDVVEFTEIGNEIYKNYELVEKLLNNLNKLGKEKGWEFVKKEISKNEKYSKLIKKLSYKKNLIELDL
jgi:predicted ribosome quality control (RQC) complex YloA/Tae2 family protein